MNIRTFFPQLLFEHEITTVTDHSEEVINGALFFDLSNGKHLTAAISKGAKTVVTNLNLTSDNNVNYFIHPYPQKVMARFYQKYYTKYIDRLKIISITGTNGKTTSVLMLYKYLRYINHNVICISSNGNYINDQYYPTRNTTDRLHVIYHLVKEANFVKGFLIIEASSQAIRTGRLWMIPLDALLITNITSDHLDYHHTNDDYFFSKMLMINNLREEGVVVVNGDPKNYLNIEHLAVIKNISPHEVYTFGLESNDYQLTINEKVEEELIINGQMFQTTLPALFNKINITGIYSVLSVLKLKLKSFGAFLKQGLTIDGRLNRYLLKGRDIVVDYAHTIKSVEVTLSYLRQKTKGQLIVVIGCGGDRDKSKRSPIGKIACLYSDIVIFTEDNNRSEPFDNIVGDICQAITNTNYLVEPSRFEAIKKALLMSNNQDMIALIGKGIEKTQTNDLSLNDYEMVMYHLREGALSND